MKPDERLHELAMSTLRHFVRSQAWRIDAERPIGQGAIVRGSMFAIASGLAYAASIIACEVYNREAPKAGVPPKPAPPKPDPRSMN